MTKVIKRDGKLVDFEWAKIQLAIESAYLDLYGEIKSSEIDTVIEAIEVEPLLEYDDGVTVEEIQDIVVKCLKEVNKDVAEAYQKYREERTKIREYNTDTYKKLGKVLNATDIVNSNANVDEASFGGRKFETAGLIMKKMALDTLVPSDVANAHVQNRGYIHK